MLQTLAARVGYFHPWRSEAFLAASGGNGRAELHRVRSRRDGLGFQWCPCVGVHEISELAVEGH
eukprot:13993142-Alexandrium_andersonii.AAC.1